MSRALALDLIAVELCMLAVALWLLSDRVRDRTKLLDVLVIRPGLLAVFISLRGLAIWCALAAQAMLRGA